MLLLTTDKDFGELVFRRGMQGALEVLLVPHENGISGRLYRSRPGGDDVTKRLGWPVQRRERNSHSADAAYQAWY